VLNSAFTVVGKQGWFLKVCVTTASLDSLPYSHTFPQPPSAPVPHCSLIFKRFHMEMQIYRLLS